MDHVFVWTFKDVVGLTVLGLILLAVLGVALWEYANRFAKKIRKFFNL